MGLKTSPEVEKMVDALSSGAKTIFQLELTLSYKGKIKDTAYRARRKGYNVRYDRTSKLWYLLDIRLIHTKNID